MANPTNIEMQEALNGLNGCIYNFLFLYFILCVVFNMHLCLCTMDMPDAFRGWNMMVDPLELDLLIIVKYLYTV